MAAGLVDLLQSIHTVADLPALADRLGGQPWFEEIPGPPLPGAVRVGRSGEFSWYGIELSGEVATRRAARSIARAGESAGVLALDAAGRRLTIAVADTVPASRTVDLRQPAAADLSCLRRMAAGSWSGSALARAAQLAAMLRLEDAGQRFFRAFHQLLGRFARAIPHRDPSLRAPLALLQLTRVLFLYFVQSKGWLDGRPAFLREELDRCLRSRRHVHRQFLKPLFFGTLNRPAAGRGRVAAGLGRVPFLNGGLFEPHPLERSWPGVVPNHLWQEAFDDVFERFAFTVHEPGAEMIAPDMLGRVFEGVMAPDHRHATGAYYTPAALVTRVVNQALAAWLARRTGMTATAAMDALRRPSPEIRLLLRQPTILDPAVGSGAFLVGMLERLTDLDAPSRTRRHVARRRILTRLFGVDRDAMAVRLTELRLWLAVVADDPTPVDGHVRPLPNLDCMVRQGDSLMDPLSWSLRMDRSGGPVPALREHRRNFLSATGAGKQEAARALRMAEHAAASALAARAEARALERIRQVVADARGIDLFGHATRMDRQGRRRFLVARRAWHHARGIRRRLSTEREVPWFQYEVAFADVLAGGGFDLVVGNPPWVRAERLSPALRAHLAGRYRWWRTGRATGSTHQPDLAIAFLERAVELVSQDGVVALLLPSKTATSGYAECARLGMSRQLTLHTVTPVAEETGAFPSGAYPMLIVAIRSAPAGGDVITSLTTPPRALPQEHFAAGGPWIITTVDTADVLRSISGLPTLGSELDVHLGVKTGANAIFLHREPPVEEELFRRTVRGRDLARARIPGGMRIIWTHDATGDVMKDLPPRAEQYFSRHRNALVSRRDYQGGPPWTLFRTAGLRLPFRVAWPDLSRELVAFLLTDRVIPLNTCYYIPFANQTRACALRAWLVSTWIRALARLHADAARGGYRRYNARCLRMLPLVMDGPTGDALAVADPGTADGIVAESLELTHGQKAALQRVLADTARSC